MAAPWKVTVHLVNGDTFQARAALVEGDDHIFLRYNINGKTVTFPRSSVLYWEIEP